MRRLNYEIGEQAKPYFDAVARLMRRQLGPEFPVRMLDLGCSYGVGSALLNYGLSFSEIADFFTRHRNNDYRQCVEDTRDFLATTEQPQVAECFGADCSSEAIQFASDAGLIEAGIARNLETGQRLSDAEVRLVQQCNFLTSTGAIGYVGARTLSVLLSHFGKASALPHGPYVAVTILRMFKPDPIAQTFEQFGYRFQRVTDVRLRQRRFDGKRELHQTLELLHQLNVNPDGWETEGYLYADLFAAAPPRDFSALVCCLERTHEQLEARELDGTTA